jgi:hypothetical protein
MLRFFTRPSLLRHLLFVQAVLFALLVGVTSTLAILAFYQPQEGELHQQLQVVASGIAGGAAMAGSSPEAARDAGPSRAMGACWRAPTSAPPPPRLRPRIWLKAATLPWAIGPW